MRKSVKLTKTIIAELEKHGNVLNTCSKVGISTSTYYRWCDDDSEFRNKVNNAIEIGRMNITDLAESKLIQNITNGDQRAIEFQLKGNDRRYMPMNHKNMYDWKEEFRARNDLSAQKEHLENLATGIFLMYQEKDHLKYIAKDVPTENLMRRPAHGNMYNTNYDEREYIGKMMASSFMQDLARELKQKLGDDFTKIAGSMNYEDTEENNPKTRQDYLIGLLRDEDAEPDFE
jgi:hypothetical protein